MYNLSGKITKKAQKFAETVEKRWNNGIHVPKKKYKNKGASLYCVSFSHNLECTFFVIHSTNDNQ